MNSFNLNASALLVLAFVTTTLACTSVSPITFSAQSFDAEYIENPSGPVSATRDTLVKILPAPDKGFHYAYYLYIPAHLMKEPQTVLYVEPNNTGTQNDDLDFHDRAARKFIEKSYSRRIAEKLKTPMLVSVFPRLASRPQEYTHYLNRRTLKIFEGPLRRVDLQLKAMIEDARARLAQNGFQVAPKVFMNGFSSSAGFILRFTALHPDMVQASVAGGVNALPILPLKKWEGRTLPYPVGVGDLKKLIGEDFDSKTFLRIPQKLYMGALDTHDTVPFRDSWDADEAEFITQSFGAKMLPDRWDKIRVSSLGSG